MAGKFARKNNKDDFYSYEVSGKEKEYHTTQFARWTGNLSNVQATGGVVSDFESPTGDIWRVHTFSGSGTFSVTGTGDNPAIGPSINDVEYMIIAGGGGGGANWGSGGGAGGVITNQSGHNMTNSVTFPLSVGSYPIVVGGGGAVGVPGAATTAFSQTAEGGGRGSSAASVSAGIPAIIAADPGGSGGGGGWPGASVPITKGTGTAGQGNDGGDGNVNSSPWAGEGGGGGASQAGTDAIQGPTGPQWASCGWGGIGTAFDFDGGGEVWYAGGGGSVGAATYTFLGTYGGRGGSGDGSQSTHPLIPNQYGAWNNAVDNRGGGGGGNSSASASYGKGGSGIVRVRYRLGPGTSKNTGAKATGGRVFLDPSGPVYYHCFDSSGTFDVLSPITGAEVLMLGGGGAGGVHLNSFGCSGGGGAGGALHKASLTIPAQTYPIVIGAGGAGTKNIAAGLGQTTTAFGIDALGGGSGRSQSHGATNPGAGGCGGGGGYTNTAGGPATQSPDTSPAPLLNAVFDGYGNAGGGASPPAPMTYEGGGGGGTGEVGNYGLAGRGQPFSNFAKAFLPSAPGYYGGGGGSSGAYTYTAPTGYSCSGQDGGGHGADMYGGTYPMPDDSRWRQAEPGVSGSGSGGGSGGLGDSPTGALPSGNGGSGVVIIMYPS